jgi:hypothetical protein
VQLAMSAKGQKRTYAVHQPISALPPKADISPRHPNVSFGLIAALEPAVVIAAMGAGHDMAADPEWPPQGDSMIRANKHGNRHE